MKLREALLPLPLTHKVVSSMTSIRHEYSYDVGLRVEGWDVQNQIIIFLIISQYLRVCGCVFIKRGKFTIPNTCVRYLPSVHALTYLGSIFFSLQA